MKKERVVVICPGRGSYNSEELGYLNQYRPGINDFMDIIDNERKLLGEPTISELDTAEKFKRSLHTKGEHASGLIYACAMADFKAINREKFEIAAICGNSMGWYLTLAASGALNNLNAFRLVNTMGSMMKDSVVGGQVIYPLMNDDWVYSPEKEQYVMDILRTINDDSTNDFAYVSIYLGNSILLGANEGGIKRLLKELEPVKNGKIDYPFQLINHAAFHTPILKDVSKKAFEFLPLDMFQKPRFPIIDGRGRIWQPYSSDLPDLRDYTLGHQVIAEYNFSDSVAVALKEFAPDKLILLGPGSSLGGAIGQVMINLKWRGVSTKSDFINLQKTEPFLLSMGRSEQKALLM